MSRNQQLTLDLFIVLILVVVVLKTGAPKILQTIFTYHPVSLDLNPADAVKNGLQNIIPTDQQPTTTPDPNNPNRGITTLPDGTQVLS